MANILSIAVEPTCDTHDRQSRLLVDGEDWLGPEVAGLDPPVLGDELLGKGVGTLVVGRCWCGIMGCNDVAVEARRREGWVIWQPAGARRLVFRAADYDREVERFAGDTSWEPLVRTVEREVGQLFEGTTIKGGFEFEFASTRIDREVRLYYRKGGRQKSLKFRWDGASLADALNQARLFRAERLSHCDQAHAPAGRGAAVDGSSGGRRGGSDGEGGGAGPRGLTVPPHANTKPYG